MEKLNTCEALDKYRKSVSEEKGRGKIRILICTTGCRALGAEEVYKTFQAEIEMQSLKDKVEVVDTGCQGLCTRAPVLTIEPMGIFDGRVTETDVHEIISRTVLKGEIIERLCCTEDGKRIPYQKDISFYKKQKSKL